jgi:hypothetical protein
VVCTHAQIAGDDLLFPVPDFLEQKAELLHAFFFAQAFVLLQIQLDAFPKDSRLGEKGDRISWIPQ